MLCKIFPEKVKFVTSCIFLCLNFKIFKWTIFYKRETQINRFFCIATSEILKSTTIWGVVAETCLLSLGGMDCKAVYGAALKTSLQLFWLLRVCMDDTDFSANNHQLFAWSHLWRKMLSFSGFQFFTTTKAITRVFFGVVLSLQLISCRDSQQPLANHLGAHIFP